MIERRKPPPRRHGHALALRGGLGGFVLRAQLGQKQSAQRALTRFRPDILLQPRLVAQLRGVEADEILITESMLREGEDVFLDDMTLAQAQEALGVRITPVPDDGADLLDALRGNGGTSHYV